MSSTSLKIRATSASVPFATQLTNGRHEWSADEPAALGGGDIGQAPLELLLSSLGACTVITLQMYAGRKQWPLEHISVEVHLVPGSGTAGLTQLTRQITLLGPLDVTQRARLLEIANACPVHKTLTGTIHIETSLTV